MKEKVSNNQNILVFINFDVDLLEFIYSEHIPNRPFKINWLLPRGPKRQKFLDSLTMNHCKSITVVIVLL